MLQWRYKGKDKKGRDKYRATWKGWIFHGDGDRCKLIRGSFHKYHHGGTNWQDYTYTQFRDTVATLCDAFVLHDAGLKLKNLEVGVNIVPPIPTADVLRSIVRHFAKGRAKNAYPVPMKDGNGIRIVHVEYRFKIYDKAAQYRQHVAGELLRFEVKATRMRVLAGCHVHTVADLLDPAVWIRLRAFLLAKFDELLIAEPMMPTEGLRTEIQRELVASAADPTYWQAFDRETRKERRKAYAKLVERIVPDGLSGTLRALIAAKSLELKNCDGFTKGMASTPDPENVPVSPRGQRRAKAPRKGQKTPVSQLVIKGETGAPTPPVPGGDATPSEVPSAGVRRCLACGRDISHQDPRSRVCSERLYGKAGKACRNKLSNNSLTLRRMKDRGPLLFDQRPFVAVATSSPPPRTPARS
ncbi:MAG TPA: hypothetical protein PKD45_15435 [Flavobacteriales bacterium]|nr:hypothetical protein [Flavobacteriales bacterium]